MFCRENWVPWLVIAAAMMSEEKTKKKKKIVNTNLVIIFTWMIYMLQIQFIIFTFKFLFAENSKHVYCQQAVLWYIIAQLNNPARDAIKTDFSCISIALLYLYNSQLITLIQICISGINCFKSCPKLCCLHLLRFIKYDKIYTLLYWLWYKILVFLF